MAQMTTRRRAKRFGKKIRARQVMRLEWTSMGQFTAMVDHGKRGLALIVTPRFGEWLAIALEAPLGSDVGAVLDSHAHQNLGVFGSALEAFAACERFSLTWMRERSEKALDCACDEIQPKRSKRRR